MGMYVCMYMYVILIEQLQHAVSQQKSKACTDSEAGINSGLQIWHSFLKISICWPVQVLMGKSLCGISSRSQQLREEPYFLMSWQQCNLSMTVVLVNPAFVGILIIRCWSNLLL
jgi:hypothetical protein